MGFQAPRTPRTCGHVSAIAGRYDQDSTGATNPSAEGVETLQAFIDTFGRSIRTAFAIAAATSSALAAETTVGGTFIQLPPPAGFCDLSDTDPSDKSMLTVTSDLVSNSGNKLLSMSADCRQLTDWRAQKRPLDDYAQYQTPVALIEKSSTESVKKTCAGLRAQGDKLVAEKAPNIKSRMESVLEKVKMNEMRFIGVLAEDSTACYGGLIHKFQTEAGTDKTQLTVFAATNIKNKSIFVYRMTVYMTSETVDTTLASLKTNIAALLAANPN